MVMSTREYPAKNYALPVILTVADALSPEDVIEYADRVMERYEEIRNFAFPKVSATPAMFVDAKSAVVEFTVRYPRNEEDARWIIDWMVRDYNDSRLPGEPFIEHSFSD